MFDGSRAVGKTARLYHFLKRHKRHLRLIMVISIKLKQISFGNYKFYSSILTFSPMKKAKIEEFLMRTYYK